MMKIIILVRNTEAEKKAKESIKNIKWPSKIYVEIEKVPTTFDGQDIVIISPLGRFCGTRGIEMVGKIVG